MTIPKRTLPNLTIPRLFNRASANSRLMAIALAPLLLLPGAAWGQVESNKTMEKPKELVDVEEPAVRKMIDLERDEFEQANAAFEAGNIEEVTGTTVASFTLSNGNKVQFVAVPEDNEVSMIEVVPSGSRPVAQGRQRSPLAAYLALAPAGAAIPKELVITASPEEAQRLVSGRTITLKPVADTYVDVERLDITAPPQTAQSVSYCTPTPAGALYFVVHSCKDENLQTSYCDPGSFISNWNWQTLIRQSSSKKRNSHGRTAACGANGVAEHYYWNGFKWKGIKTVEIGANSQVWKTHAGAWLPKRYRRIRHRTFHPQLGGFIRAWSEFYD